MMFATASDAEAAYYRAFAQADLEQMSRVWLDSPSIVCTHPMAARIVGYRLIIGSFMGLFQNQGEMAVTLEQVETMLTKDMSVRTGVEVLHQDAMEYRMQVTNVFRSTEEGWKMVLHHASPVHTVEPPSRVESQVH